MPHPQPFRPKNGATKISSVILIFAVQLIVDLWSVWPSIRPTVNKSTPALIMKVAAL